MGHNQDNSNNSISFNSKKSKSSHESISIHESDTDDQKSDEHESERFIQLRKQFKQLQTIKNKRAEL